MRLRIRAVAGAAVVTALLAASPAGSKVARGFPDPKFDRDGVVQTNFGGYDIGTALAVQPDGKILAAGYVNGYTGVARYAASGRLDRSFSRDGKVALSFEGPSYPTAIAAAPGGKIVVAGVHARYLANDECCQYGIAVARLTRSGALDTSFGDGGKMIVEVPNGSRMVGIHPAAMSVLADGSVVVGGSVFSDPVDYETEWALETLSPVPLPRVENLSLWLSKLTPQGERDPTFGLNGGVVLNVDGGDNVLSDIALASDGAIVAVGRTNGDPRPGMVVARLLSAGVLDPTFGPGGFRVIRPGNDRDTGATGVSVLRSGAVLISGYAAAGLSQSSPDESAIVVKLRPDGSEDGAYGRGGVARFQIGSSSRATGIVTTASGAAYLLGAVGRPNGMIYIGLGSDGQSTVFALDPKGKLVRRFGYAGAGALPTELVYTGGIALHKGMPLVIGTALAGTFGRVCQGNFCFYAGAPDFDFNLTRLRP